MSVRYGQVPQLVPISDAGAAYHLICERVDALVRGRDGIAELAVPACPGWTIRQVVAHGRTHRSRGWDGSPTNLMPAFTDVLPAFTNDGLRPPTSDLIE